jgi:hypothetical protein
VNSKATKAAVTLQTPVVAAEVDCAAPVVGGEFTVPVGVEVFGGVTPPVAVGSLAGVACGEIVGATTAAVGDKAVGATPVGVGGDVVGVATGAAPELSFSKYTSNAGVHASMAKSQESTNPSSRFVQVRAEPYSGQVLHLVHVS